MKKKRRLFENVFSLFFLQTSNYILPLVTLPYLVRVLGPEKFGLVVFSQAFIQYFVLLTDYGFNYTATRDIAINIENNKKVAEIFSSVLFIRVILLILSGLFLMLFVTAIPKFCSDWLIYLITFITVIGNALFPIYFFQGIQKMKYITYLNLIAKLLTTTMIFIFINNQQDYLLVALIQSSSSLIIAFLALALILKYYPYLFVIPSRGNICNQVKSGFDLFLTNTMSNILSNSGIFVLGLFFGNETVGIYSSIEKVVKAIQGLFSPLTQSLFPYAVDKFKSSYTIGQHFWLRSTQVIVALALVTFIITGLVIDQIVMLLYSGKINAPMIIEQLLCIWAFFGIFNNCFGIQYLVALGCSKEYKRSFFIASTVTLAIYCTAIPALSLYGVAYGMNLGELTLTIMLLYDVRRINRYKLYH